MARSLSAPAIASQNAQQTNEVWLVLLTITHPDITTLRFVNNTDNVVSNSQTFTAFPFEVVLPTQDADNIPRASLRIDNVDRSIVAALRTLTSPPTVQFDVILASSPNTIEATFPGMKLMSATYTAATVEGELGPELLYTEPVSLSMTPSRFPGMF